MSIYYDDERGLVIDGMSLSEREQAYQGLSADDMRNYGIIEPQSQPTQQISQINEGEENKTASPSSFIDKAGKKIQQTAYAIDDIMGDYHRPTDKAYEKLSVVDTWKDIGKAVTTEASHLFQKKEDEFNYDTRTKAGEIAQYIYRYGVGTAVSLVGGGYLRALGMAGKLGKLSKPAASVGTFLTGRYAKLEALKQSERLIPKITGHLTASSLAGTSSSALAGFVLSRQEENEETIFDMLPNNPFSLNDEDSEVSYKAKHALSDAIGGLIGNPVVDYGLTPIAKYTIGKPLGVVWDKFKNLFKAKEKENIEQAAKEVVEANLNADTVVKNTKLINTIQKVLDETGINDVEELKRYLKENNITDSSQFMAVDEIFDKLQKGQSIIPKEDGSFSIYVTKYQDAADVSLEELVQQTGNNGVRLMDEAVNDVWHNRAVNNKGETLLKEGENLIKTTETFTQNGKPVIKTSPDDVAVEKVTNYYKNKWNIKNEIKVEFVNGKIDGKADGQTLKANAPKKDNSIAIQKKQLQIKNYENRLKKLNDYNKTVGETKKPKTIYNKTTASQAKKGIVNQIKDIMPDKPSYDTVSMRYKNRYFKRRVNTPDTAIIETLRDFYDNIQKIAKNPEIINNADELSKIEKSLERYLGKEDEELVVKLYEDYLKAVELAQKYLDVEANLKGSRGLKVKEDIGTIQERLNIAKKELNNLQAPSLNPIVIRVNKNADNINAVFRSELEHARDLVKDTVPTDKSRHFSRYEGKNESEMSLRYVKAKADKRAKKNDLTQSSITNENNFLGINTPIAQETLNTEPSTRSTKTPINTRVEGDYTYETNLQTVYGLETPTKTIKNKNGKILAQVQAIPRGNDFQLRMDNYGIEKGSARKALADLMKEFPDKTFYWEAINEQSLKSYNKFVEEYPELAKNIKFFDEVSDEAFLTQYKNYAKKVFDDNEENIINEAGNNSSQYARREVADIQGENTETFTKPETDVYRGTSSDSVVGSEPSGQQRIYGDDNISSKPNDTGISSDNSQPISRDIKSGVEGENPNNIRANEPPTIQDYTRKGNTVADILDLAAKEGELAKYEKVSWKERAISAEKLEEYFNQFDFRDMTAIKHAINKGDIETLNNAANISLVLVKKLQGLRNELVNATALSERKEIEQAMSAIQQSLDAIGSVSGSILQARKMMYKIQDVFALTNAEELGKTSFIDALNTEIKKLNFTENKPDFNKMAETIMKGLSKSQPQIMKSLAGKPELYDSFTGDLVKLIRNGEPSQGQIENLIEGLIHSREINRKAHILTHATDEGLMNCLRANNFTTYYLANLVSSPKTSIFNILGGVVNAGIQPIEKMIGGMLSSENRHLVKEGYYQFRCYQDNLTESIKLGYQAFKTGEGQLVQIGRDTPIGEGKKQIENMGKFLDFNNPRELTQNKALNQVFQGVRDVQQIGLRLLGAEDEALTQLFYRSNVQAKALMQAEKNGKALGLNGEQLKAYVKANSSDYLDNAFNISGKPMDVEAYAEAREMLYQTPLNGKYWDYASEEYAQLAPKTVVRNVASWLQSGKSWVRLIVPFVRTPANIGQQTLERDLLYNICSNAQREIIMSNTRQGALARGRLGLAVMTYTSCYMWGLTGQITGHEPTDPKLRAKLYATGWRPYSIKTSDGKYISYRGIVPIEQFLGFGANMANLTQTVFNKEQEPQIMQYMIDSYRSLIDLYLEPTGFLGGMEQMGTLAKAFSGDFEGAETGLANTFRGFLPLSNAVKFGSDLLNPTQTKPDNFKDKIFNRYGNLGLGDYKRNMFGESQSVYELGFTKASQSSNMPEDEEIMRLMEDGSFTPTQLKDGETGYTFKYSDFKNTSYGRSLYDLFQEQMSTTKINGQTLREAVRELVTSDKYQDIALDGSLKEARENNQRAFTRVDNTKINAIKDIFDEYRNQAKKEVLEAYGDVFFDENGNSANDIKQIQDENKINRLNQTIEDIRSFSE